jgi:hypothetical protein
MQSGAYQGMIQGQQFAQVCTNVLFTSALLSFHALEVCADTNY